MIQSDATRRKPEAFVRVSRNVDRVFWVYEEARVRLHWAFACITTPTTHRPNTAELMERLVLVLGGEKGRGEVVVDDLSTFFAELQKAAKEQSPEAAGKGSAQQGLFLKTRPHGNKVVCVGRGGVGNGKNKRANAHLA